MSTAQTSPSPSSLFKSMLRDSGLYSIAIMGQRLLSMILLPVTTRFLAPADYGVLELLEQTGSALSLLLGASFSSALGYFYAGAASETVRRRVTSTTIVGAGAIGLLAGALCWPFARPLSRAIFGGDAATYSLHIVFISMPAMFLLEALLVWLRVSNRAGVWLVSSLTRLAATAAGVLLFVAVLHLKVVGVQYAALAAALAPLPLAGVCFLTKSRAPFDAKAFVRMARFAAPLGLSGAAMFVVNFGDRFVLPRYISFADLGLYALAYKIGMLISAVYASFQIYWSAQAYGIMKRDDADAVFARTCTYVVLGVGACGLAIVLVSKPVLRVLAAPEYYAAVRFVPLLVAAYCIRSVGEFFRCLFLVEGRPGYDAICTWTSSAVCLAGYFTLIPWLGAWGAAAATALTFIVFTTVAVVWTQRLKPRRVETARLAKVAAALTLTAALYAAFPISGLALQLLWAALLFSLFAAALWLMRFPTKGEREKLRQAGASIRGAARFRGHSTPRR